MTYYDVLSEDVLIYIIQTFGYFGTVRTLVNIISPECLTPNIINLVNQQYHLELEHPTRESVIDTITDPLAIGNCFNSMSFDSVNYSYNKVGIRDIVDEIDIHYFTPIPFDRLEAFADKYYYMYVPTRSDDNTVCQYELVSKDNDTLCDTLRDILCDIYLVTRRLNIPQNHLDMFVDFYNDYC